jgi:PPM family protein phosphatase
MLDVEFAQLSDVGRVRDHNEDFLGYALPGTPEQARTTGWLFALADGVGGQDLGEVASRAAVDCLLAGFRSASGGEAPGTLLPRLMQAANAHVFETGMAATKSGTSMATTLVACVLRFDRMVVAHVGDSRCYLIRHGRAEIRTRDHTMVNEQLRLGVLTARQAAGSDSRHLLSRSVGMEMFVSAETAEHLLLPGDVLLQCSDGLHGSVEPSEIATLVSHTRDLNESAQKLVDIANERDGSDNISVQLIRVRNVERVGMYRGRPYKLR